MDSSNCDRRHLYAIFAVVAKQDHSEDWWLTPLKYLKWKLLFTYASNFLQCVRKKRDQKVIV